MIKQIVSQCYGNAFVKGNLATLLFSLILLIHYVLPKTFCSPLAVIYLFYVKYHSMLKSILISHFAFQAPSQPPGNVVWNATDTKVLLNWEQVKAMENESEVTGYKVSCVICNAFFSYLWQYFSKEARFEQFF